MLDGPDRAVSKHHHPTIKKALELTRDHRTAMDAPHAFRKGWPKKKATVNRRFRRAVSEQLASVSDGGESLSVQRHPHSLWKSGVSTLRERISSNHESRITRHPSYMLKVYSAESAKRFIKFLDATINGRSADAQGRAKWLRALLYDLTLSAHSTVGAQQRWLRCFLEEHAEQAQRIHAWAATRE